MGGVADVNTPIRCAYADPPYVGQSRRLYGRAEVNHRLLIAYLCDDFNDGWALSCSTPSLRDLLALCPRDVRVGAWVKPFCSFKPNITPAYAWEPVLFRGGRARTRTDPTPRDWVSANITLETGLPGAKPRAFAYWIFELLNLTVGDELTDIFPGTGNVGEAWARYVERFDFTECSK